MSESPASDPQRPPAPPAFDWAGLVAHLRQPHTADAATRTLAQRLAPGLEVVLRQQGLDADQRADLVQECLSAVVRAAQSGRLEAPAAIPAFARSTAQHLAIDAKRRSARETRLTESAWEQLPSGSRGPAERLEQEQLRALVQRLLGELTVPRDREVLQRHYVMEEDKTNICQRLGLSPEHFDRVVHRARQRFRTLWEQIHGHG